ncbi:MAG: HU family DNA-binding protein [Chitinophagaceae bacterium]|nr:HU family DNA-binding protein [Chitinophagaceae bacterium]
MRKTELISIIAEKTNLPKANVLVVLESLLSEIEDAIKRGEDVSLRTFGTFRAQKRAGKKARDIMGPKGAAGPEQYMPKFVPSKEFTCALRSRHK